MYYRIINIRTNRPMALSYNSTSLNVVREDVILYISVDEAISENCLNDLSDLMVQSNLRLEQSEIPFSETDNPSPRIFTMGLDETNTDIVTEIAGNIYTFGSQLVLTKPKEQYAPKGRVSHVSTYALS